MNHIYTIYKHRIHVDTHDLDYLEQGVYGERWGGGGCVIGGLYGCTCTEKKLVYRK